MNMKHFKIFLEEFNYLEKVGKHLELHMKIILILEKCLVANLYIVKKSYTKTQQLNGLDLKLEFQDFV